MYTKPHYNKHLTITDRNKIEALYNHKVSKKEIALAVGVSYPTICREVKRGRCTLIDSELRPYEAYSAYIAQKDYDKKKRYKGRSDKLGHNHDYASFLEMCISKHRYSVDAALYAAKDAGYDFSASRTTLYRYIDLGYLKLTNKHLPQGKRKKKKHDKRNPARSAYRSIEQREISRDDFGHWEMDTVGGPAKGKSSCTLALTERKARQEIIIKLPEKTAANTVQAINYIARKLGPQFSDIFKTITMDNGSESADAVGIEFHKGKQRTTVFYCHPYSSCERASNENANKLIRRHIPKGKSMVKIAPKIIKAVQNWINHYPRPMFKGKSSNHIFYQCLKEEGIPITPAIKELFPVYENYLEKISVFP